MERKQVSLQGMALGAMLVLAGYLIGDRSPTAAHANGAFQSGTAPVGMVACQDGGFVIVTGSNGRYFHINEMGKARAVSTDGGEFIDWK